MDVMQKFKERLRRNSSSDVKSICISTMPDNRISTTDIGSRSVGGVIRRYSIPAKPKHSPEAKLDGSLFQGDVFEDTKYASSKEGNGSAEKKRLLEAFRVLQLEKADVEVKLENANDKLKERDETIKELHTAITQIKEDRLQDEEVRYQRSILAKRQYIDSLESEIEKMKAKIEQDNIEVENRVKKARKMVSRVKQDCALKIFELQQENISLKEEIKRYEGRQFPTSKNEPHKCATTKIDKIPNENPDSKSKNELVVRLSEQISSLALENSKLKEELQTATRKLLKYEKYAKTSKSSVKLVDNS